MELLPSRRVFHLSLSKKQVPSTKHPRESNMQAMHSASGKIDNIRHDLQALRNDIAKLTQELPSVLSDVRDDSLKAARDRVYRMKSDIDASLAQLSDRGRDAAKAVNDATGDVARGIEVSLREHPFAVIALAIGIGCVVGATLRR